MLVRFWEEGRKKALTILGQEGIEEFVVKGLDLAYPHIHPRLGYPLSFIEVEPGDPVSSLGCSWISARNDHPQRDLALRLEAGGRSVFYSGDGRPTPESEALARHADLIVHEAFGIEEGVPGHGSVMGCIDFARSCQVKRLALVHIQRGLRRERLTEIREMAESVKDVQVLIPEPGDRLTI